MALPRRSAHEAALSLAYDDLDWSVALDDSPKDVQRASTEDVATSKAALARVYCRAATRQQDKIRDSRKSSSGASSTRTLPSGVRSVDERATVDGLSTPGGSFISRRSLSPASAAIMSAYDDLDWTTAVDDEADSVVDRDPLPSSSTVPGMVSRATCLPGSFMWSASLQNHPLRSNADETARRPKSNSLLEVGASKLTKTRLGFWKNLSVGSRSTPSQITTTSSGGVASPSTSEEPSGDPISQPPEEPPPDAGTQVVVLKHRSSPKIEDVYGEAAWDELSDQGNEAATGCVRLEEAAAAALARRSRSMVGDTPLLEGEAAQPPPNDLVKSTPHWGQQDGHHQTALHVLPEDCAQRPPDEQLRLQQKQAQLEEEKFLLQQQRTQLKRREQEWQLQQRREELALDQQRLQQSELERQLKQREDEGNRELYEERAMLQLQRQALEHAQELFKEQQRKEQLQRQQEERTLLERQERQMREFRQRQQAEEERLLMERQRKEQQQHRQQQEEERLQREQERLRQEHLKRKQEEGERVQREQQERLRRQEEEERLVRESDQRLIQEQQQRQQEEEALRRRDLELHEQRQELQEQQQLRVKHEQLQQLLQQQQQLEQQQAAVEVLLQEESMMPRQPSPKQQSPCSPKAQLQAPPQWQWQQSCPEETQAVQLEDELAQGQSPPRNPVASSLNRQASASIPYQRGAPTPRAATHTIRSPPSAEPVVAGLVASPGSVTRTVRSPPSGPPSAEPLAPEMQWMAHSSAVRGYGRCRLLDEKPVEEWDEQDVETWLLQFSAVPDELVSILQAHAINGAVLLTLEEGDFAELGITKFGHRRLLAVGAQELRACVQGRRTVTNSVVAPAGSVCPPSPVISPQGGVGIPQLHWGPPSPGVPAVPPVTVSVSTARSPSPVASNLRSTISGSPSRMQYRPAVSPLLTARGPVVRMATYETGMHTARAMTARANHPAPGPRAGEPQAWVQPGLNPVTIPVQSRPPFESSPRSPARSASPTERWH